MTAVVGCGSDERPYGGSGAQGENGAIGGTGAGRSGSAGSAAGGIGNAGRGGATSGAGKGGKGAMGGEAGRLVNETGGGGGSSGGGTEAGAPDMGAAGEAGSGEGGNGNGAAAGSSGTANNAGSSVGANGGSGDSAGSGGVSAGSGGVSAGSGGVNAGSGGVSAGSGGVSAGSGGTAGNGVNGGAGFAGTAGTASVCQAGATQPCCQGGQQTCSGGTWGACEGARITAETCNGVDDDCNGQIDDLGTFRCGVGACATTVVACGPNGVNSCIPLAPAASFDGCDGVDNDCDGAVDEDCSACVRVAPNGDDAGALGDDNATPFASVQAGIDFAAAHPNGPSRVCVAAGPTCQDSATYSGPSGADLTMRDGIDVLANYEATSWTRCSASNTRLAPQTALGVTFPAAIVSPTTLDGFTILHSTAGTSTAAITVDGGTNVVLSNLVVPLNGMVASTDGIVLQNGAEALVFRSRIDVGNGINEIIGIKSVASQLFVEDSAGADSTDGLTCAATGNGVVLHGGAITYPQQRGILLESSPGSVIENSDVCTSFDAFSSSASDRVVGIEIHGDATGVVLHNDHVWSRPFGSAKGSALAATDCGGAEPWIVGNRVRLFDTGTSPNPEVIYAAGDCHPRVDANSEISATMGSNSAATAIHCGSLGGVDSRCIVSRNPNVGVYFPTATFPATDYGVGVQCDGTACARIDHNSISGIAQAQSSGSNSVRETGYGITLNQSSALVASNYIVGVAASACNATGHGVSSNGAPRIENNVIYGSFAMQGLNCDGVKYVAGLEIGGPADVNSNYINAWPGVSCMAGNTPTATQTLAYAVTAGAGGTFRNNVMVGCASFQESLAASEPLVFENNDLPNGYLDEGATYPNLDQSDPRISAAQVNALTDMSAGDNIDAQCFADVNLIKHLAAGSLCIDAGTSEGAPHLDYDGQTRDAVPDIGADEYVP